MPRVIEGGLVARGLRVAVIAGRFNDLVVSRLVEGALDCLRRHGVAEKDIALVRVPGSFEIPQVARRIAASGKYDAIVSLGCLIRGETPHFDLIAQSVTSGISRAAEDTGVPVSFGVLTTNTLEQALERAGGKAGNKGWDAALAAIELGTLRAQRI